MSKMGQQIVPASSLVGELTNGPAVSHEKLDRAIRSGLIAVGFLVLGLGGLAATVPITGAVIAPGEIAVDSRVKKIGHPTGGVLSQLLVRDGDHVREGQVLARLDSRVSGSNSQLTGESVYQLLAVEARLMAERAAAQDVTFPAELTRRANDPNIALIMNSERSNFHVRRRAMEGQRAQLSERIRQSQAEIAGFSAQRQSYLDQSKLINEELASTRQLYQEHYTTLERLNALERSAVGVRASAASTGASTAQASARIQELRQQADSLDRERRREAADQLVDVQAKLAEYRRMKVSADDSFDRSVLRAPQAGVVDKLAFSTIGGVIPANDTIMEIVPLADKMVVRARVSIADVNDIREGGEARLRFSAFDATTTPELNGHVTHVSADRRVDERTGAAYYDVTVAIDPKEQRKLSGQVLVSGMPVETFIKTHDRTLVNILIKPLTDQIARAFRHG